MAKWSLFGFQLGKSAPAQQEVLPSFSPPVLDDGAVTVTAAAHYGTTVDLDSSYKSEIELITRYREMAMQPEIESAVEDIINEAIIQDNEDIPVSIKLDNLKVSDKVKDAIEDEFDNILTLLNFKNLGQEIFKRFYVDGRLYYTIIADEKDVKFGIKELRYVDPRKITKVREIRKEKDPKLGADLVVDYNEYFIYSENLSSNKANLAQTGVRIAPDSIIALSSGLMDAKKSMVLGYLHKAIKPLNQLRMIEDASVIYKVSRAPERRIFYIDVGNLPKMKAEQYLKEIMTKYKNKVVYDAHTGEVRDDRRALSMMDDFWIPRRGDKSTEITTLQSSAAFDDMTMVEYFERKLYMSLNVPYSRLHSPETPYVIGRSSEITRDEIKFSKFINKLRSKFTDLFDQALKVQCVFKGVCTADEFDEYKQHIFYDFRLDNNYAELKEAELIQNRVTLLTMVDPFVGKYFSVEWVYEHVLKIDEQDAKKMRKQIQQNIKDGLIPDPSLLMGGGDIPPAGPGGNDQGQPPVKSKSKDDSGDGNKKDDSDNTNPNPYY